MVVPQGKFVSTSQNHYPDLGNDTSPEWNFAGTPKVASRNVYDVCLLSGHNFGSEHDPDTPECAPADNQKDGGKYIMYPASVSGQLRNSKVM